MSVLLSFPVTLDLYCSVTIWTKTPRKYFSKQAHKKIY